MKTFIKKSIYMPITFSVLLISCNSGNNVPSNKLNSSLKSSAGLKTPIYIGAPAVKPSDDDFPSLVSATGPCIVIEDNARVVYTAAGNGTMFSMKSNMSKEEILDNLGVSGSLKGTISSVSGDFKAEYDKINTKTNLEYRITYYGKSEGRFSLQNVLDPSYAIDDPDNRVSTCGDGFISGGIGGIYYEGSLVVRFDSVVDKQNLIADGDLKITDIGQLAAKLKMAKGSGRSNFAVEIELVQRGGDASKILETFANLKLRNQVDPEKIDNQATTFYLAELNESNMIDAANAMQDYIQGDLFKQASLLRDVKTVDQVNDNVYFTNPEEVSYVKSTYKFKRSSKLRSAVNAHNNEYNQLQQLKSQYQDYVSFVADFADRDGAISAVKDSVNNLKELNLDQSNMVDNAKSCYGYIESGSEQENDCLGNLSFDIENVAKDISKIEDSKWRYGYLINQRTNSIDGFLPFQIDENGSIVSLIAYSNNLADSYYFPGSEYSYDSASKTIENSSYIFLNNNESTIYDGRLVKYTGVDSIKMGSTIKATSVMYANFDKETQDLSEYKNGNGPKGNAISYQANKSLSYKALISNSVK